MKLLCFSNDLTLSLTDFFFVFRYSIPRPTPESTAGGPMELVTEGRTGVTGTISMRT